jgi:hypothetical protein
MGNTILDQFHLGGGLTAWGAGTTAIQLIVLLHNTLDALFINKHQYFGHFW